jgi:hypothetical protein
MQNKQQTNTTQMNSLTILFTVWGYTPYDAWLLIKSRALFFWTPWTLVVLLGYLVIRLFIRSEKFEWDRDVEQGTNSCLKKDIEEKDKQIKVLKEEKSLSLKEALLEHDRATLAEEEAHSNHQMLNVAIYMMLSNEKTFKTVTAFVGVFFDYLTEINKKAFIKELSDLVASESEDSLDGAHFIEIFENAEVVMITLEDCNKLAAEAFAADFEERILGNEELRNNIEAEIKKIFSNKKDNPLVSYETFTIIKNGLEDLDFCERGAVKELVDELMLLVESEAKEGIKIQLSRINLKGKRLLKIGKVEFEDVYNKLLPLILSDQTGVVTSFQKDMIKNLAEAEFQKHVAKLQKN